MKEELGAQTTKTKVFLMNQIAKGDKDLEWALIQHIEKRVWSVPSSSSIHPPMAAARGGSLIPRLALPVANQGTVSRSPRRAPVRRVRVRTRVGQRLTRRTA